jgi:sugar lactone lactonase YvrE
MELMDTIHVGNTLGEGVIWDIETQSLWWTDIHAKHLYCYDWQAKAVEHFATPERLCSFGFVKGSRALIAAFESGFALYDPRSASLDWFARPKPDKPGTRFNDGRVDRQGRFWAGTMAESEANRGHAHLYSVDGAGRLVRRESGIMISNGICWSPDSRRFYFADSQRGAIYVYDFVAADGAISNRRVFARASDGAHPDGANVDNEGFLWSAHWGAARVVRYAPDGSIDRVLEVPTRQPTCVAFGGPDLNILFVTSARDGLTPEELEAQPSAGDVFVYKMDATGLPEGRFVLGGDSAKP